MNIKKLVQKLIKDFKTNDPFKLAELLGVLVIKDLPLGRIKGFYKLMNRVKVIYINCTLDDFERRVVCAHELGHAMMHPTVNCRFIAKYTLLSVKKVEIEANRFCAYLLIPDSELAEYHGLTYKEISRQTCIPVEIIKLRQDKAILA